MNCEQLNKDIVDFRASRDAFQKIYDYANTNLRGGAELRQSQKNLLESGDALLLKYFEDFEKQNPDKWFRKFGEFEEPSEDEKENIAREWHSLILGIDEYQRWYFHSHDEFGKLLREGLAHDSMYSMSGKPMRVITNEDDHIASSFLLVGNDYLAIRGDLPGFIVTNPIDRWRGEDEKQFSIKKKKYTQDPQTLVGLDDGRVLVGCKGGGIALIAKRDDGSWGVLEDKRWVPNPSNPISTRPMAFKLESGRIALYDSDSGSTCVFEMEKSLKKLKRALGFDEGEKEEP